MQFGLYAPIPMVTVGSPEIARSAAQAPFPLPPGVRDEQFSHSLDLLTAADAAGFELALFAERHLGGDMSAWILAAAVASRLERIRPLVAVHPGLWDPVMTAKLAVSLDRISKARIAINIVNGWFDQEFVMFGGGVLQGEERYKRSAEFIAILRGIMSSERFSYEGDHYTLRDAQLLLKPASAQPPEIFSVSTSDRGRDFIAENCDWWFVDMAKNATTVDETLRSIEESIADMNRRTARLGRKVRYGINPFLALGRTAEEALESTIQRIFEYEADPDEVKIQRRMLPATRAGCIGPAQSVLDQIRRFEEMGIELLLLKLIPTAENIARIGDEIIGKLH